MLKAAKAGLSAMAGGGASPPCADPAANHRAMRPSSLNGLGDVTLGLVSEATDARLERSDDDSVEKPGEESRSWMPLMSPMLRGSSSTP